MATEIGTIAETPPTAAPALRGWIHVAALPAALTTGVLLILAANDSVYRLAAFALTLSVAMIFGASSVYHRGPFRETRFQIWAQRCDHSTIYLAMGGIYSAYWLTVLDGGVADTVLWTVWIGAGLGVFKKFVWLGAPRWISTGSYCAVGLLGVLVIPQLIDAIGGVRTTTLAASGALLLIGAICYAAQWPHRNARHFGYHELFHALVVMAMALQFGVFASLVLR